MSNRRCRILPLRLYIAGCIFTVRRALSTVEAPPLFTEEALPPLNCRQRMFNGAVIQLAIQVSFKWALTQ